MVKQIRDYVLEGRLIRESKEQKNEATYDYKKEYRVVGETPLGDFKLIGHYKDIASAENAYKSNKRGYVYVWLLQPGQSLDGLDESAQKNEADYSKDWELYRNGAKGSFMQHLAQAFQQADMKNAKKLYDAFPEVGKLFILWKTNGQKDKI